jgi:3-deoxy-7-phosphoheptulonate synthase
MSPDELCELTRILNPTNEPGRLMLIHRMGHENIATKLPGLIESLEREGRRILWVCDPMHGNTRTAASGHKTRRFDEVLGELRQSIHIHSQCGSRLGGVHLELTGENVTECVGGSGGLTEADLHTAYQTHCDPRLNYEQALEIAFAIADEIKKA